jgi:hypothetical protein
VSATIHVHLMRTPVVTATVDEADTTYVTFTSPDLLTRVTLSDTPEALVATLTEALEAVDRAWRASRGDQ